MAPRPDLPTRGKILSSLPKPLEHLARGEVVVAAEKVEAVAADPLGEAPPLLRVRKDRKRRVPIAVLVVDCPRAAANARPAKPDVGRDDGADIVRGYELGNGLVLPLRKDDHLG